DGEGGGGGLGGDRLGLGRRHQDVGGRLAAGAAAPPVAPGADARREGRAESGRRPIDEGADVAPLGGPRADLVADDQRDRTSRREAPVVAVVLDVRFDEGIVEWAV